MNETGKMTMDTKIIAISFEKLVLESGLPFNRLKNCTKRSIPISYGIFHASSQSDTWQ